MSDPDTIRAALDKLLKYGHAGLFIEGVAALDSLVARLADAERECSERVAAELGWDGATTALERAEARLRVTEEALREEEARLRAEVADCCGDKRQFCESYGCSTLRDIADRLAALAASPGRVDG